MEQDQSCVQWQALALLLYFLFQGLLYNSFTIANYAALNTWMIDDVQMGEDLEGKGYVLTEVLIWHLSAGLSKMTNHCQISLEIITKELI